MTELLVNAKFPWLFQIPPEGLPLTVTSLRRSDPALYIPPPILLFLFWNTPPDAVSPDIVAVTVAVPV